MRSVIALLITIYQQSNVTSESRIQEQATTSLSSFYRLHPQEFLESVIDISFGENPPKVRRSRTFLAFPPANAATCLPERFQYH